MLVSTFELLVKPQLPIKVDPPLPTDVDVTKLSRTVIQGYFLTLANVTNTEVAISLVFSTLSTKSFSEIIDSTYIFLDVSGENKRADLDPPRTRAGKLSYTFTIPANSTSLFILQPDITKNQGEILKSANFELRGYVEVQISSTSLVRSTALLLTPEHRGTFYKNLENDDPQLDQIVYTLPTASGGSLFRLSSP